VRGIKPKMATPLIKNLWYNVLMNILMDASAIITMVINEPEKDLIINLTKDVELLFPEMVPFEIGNALTSLKRRKILNDEEIIEGPSAISSVKSIMR
jgi:predicted nucleic acid-binding protein